MKTVEIEDATLSLADYARKIGREPCVITERGKPVAVLLSLEDADLETASISLNPRFLDLIERSRARIGDEGGISAAEVRNRLGLGE